MNEFCTEITQDAGVSLHGTAAHAEVWLLLEYGGEWRMDAVGDNDLSAETQTWLHAQTSTIPHSRTLFIKQQATTRAGAFYVAITRESDQRLYRFDLASFDDLHAIDVAALVNNQSDHPQSDEQLILVCTNGKRDRCCAKFGLPIYQEIGKLEIEGVGVWQCTHLGGHRFAGVLAVLPLGIYYGYVSAETLPPLLSALQQNDLFLPCYRGRTFYAGVENAADFHNRSATQNMAANSTTITQRTPISDNTHRVHFSDGNALTICKTTTDPVLVGCSMNKYKPQPHYGLLTDDD